MDQLYREKVRETVLHCWVGNIAIIQYSPWPPNQNQERVSVRERCYRVSLGVSDGLLAFRNYGCVN